VKFDDLKPGDEVRVPNVEPFKIEDMPATGNYPDKPEFKSRRIVINRRDTILELYDGDKLIASIPIAPGSPTHPTPPGKWRILGVAAMPTFRWDNGVLNHGVRTENFYMLPAGPNNPVGVGWLGLNKPGIGIHGTNNPYSIGTWPATAACGPSIGTSPASAAWSRAKCPSRSSSGTAPRVRAARLCSGPVAGAVRVRSREID
jgi:hypothetical protein